MKQKIALMVGMARSGVSSTKLLATKGYRVIINDRKKSIPGLSEQLAGIEYIDALGRDPMELLGGVDLMVLSPVVPIFAPFAVEAKRRGIEIIGEIELGYRYCKGDFVCISGTNGKTTTTALTGEVFKTGGRNTFVLGNIGIPITEHALETREGDVIVAEVAALQLESIDRFHARAAAMLNITEDHLNRFRESMDEYVAAKCRIFENQTEDDFVVLNYDDPLVRDMARLTRARILYFSRREQVQEGAFVQDGAIVFRMDGVLTRVTEADRVCIPGAHNLENALAAVCLGLCMGLSAESVAKALEKFPGVEHRLEVVRELDGVLYINDSKATNPDSSIKAVEAMTRPTVLLLGVGEYDKHSDFTPLFEAFGGRIKAVLASGLNIPAIKRAAKEAGFAPVIECQNDLAQMVDSARSLAEPGDTVLLSPAAASWGLFEDFEHRGRVFKDVVFKLGD